MTGPAQPTDRPLETGMRFVAPALVKGLPGRVHGAGMPYNTGMITVHHLNNSRSQRVLWLLEDPD